MQIYDAIILFLTMGVLMSCGPSFTTGSLGAMDDKFFQPGPENKSLDQDEGFWDLGQGIKIHYTAAGKGEPVIVIHGGPGTPGLGSWPALRPLENRFRFYYPDACGSGQSSRPIDRWANSDWGSNILELEKKLGLTAQLGDIERIRRILGVEKITLIGHSFGGLEAFLYATEFPQHVKNLVLISPATLLRLPAAPGADLYAEVEKHLTGPNLVAFRSWKARFFDFSQVWTLTEKDWVAAVEEFIPYWKLAAVQKGATWGSQAPDNAAIGGWMQAAVFFSLGSQFDYRPLLKNIKAPTTLFYGDKDVTPPEAWRDWEGLPQAKTIKLPGAGHFPFTDPQGFTKLLEEALEGK